MKLRHWFIRKEIGLLLKHFPYQVKDVLEDQGKHISFNPGKKPKETSAQVEHEWMDEFRRLAMQGLTAKALKLYREGTGTDLQHAINAMWEVREKNGWKRPDFSQPVGQSHTARMAGL